LPLARHEQRFKKKNNKEEGGAKVKNKKIATFSSWRARDKNNPTNEASCYLEEEEQR
jgi:hypothetical protein